MGAISQAPNGRSCGVGRARNAVLVNPPRKPSPTLRTPKSQVPTRIQTRQNAAFTRISPHSSCSPISIHLSSRNNGHVVDEERRRSVQRAAAARARFHGPDTHCSSPAPNCGPRSGIGGASLARCREEGGDGYGLRGGNALAARASNRQPTHPRGRRWRAWYTPTSSAC